MYPKAFFSQFETAISGSPFIRVLSYTYVIKTHGLYRTGAIIKMYLMAVLCKPFPLLREKTVNFFLPPVNERQRDGPANWIPFWIGIHPVRLRFRFQLVLFTFSTLCHGNFRKNNSGGAFFGSRRFSNLIVRIAMHKFDVSCSKPVPRILYKSQSPREGILVSFGEASFIFMPVKRKLSCES